MAPTRAQGTRPPEAGEFVAPMGQSGGGKTTLLSLITGLDAAAAEQWATSVAAARRISEAGGGITAAFPALYLTIPLARESPIPEPATWKEHVMSPSGQIPQPRTAQPSAPLPGTWQVLSACSEVGICGRASRFAPTVRAAFAGVRGELLIDDEPDRSQVAIEIDLETLTTGNPVYDDVLVRADPFRIAQHPVARFRSAEVRWVAGEVRVTGMLSLAGNASVLTLTGTYTENSAGTAELAATGQVATAILGRFSMPGASLLVPKSMTLAVRVRAQHTAVALAA